MGLFLLAVLVASGPPEHEPFPPHKSAEESLRAMRPRPGFQVELIAAEPLVQSPIAFAWGPDGKFWVVEMRDYPLGADGKGGPGGRVKFLEDTNGDGKYDKATVLVDNLSYPTGVMPWRKGVLVTCAPEIFYAEDTNGDGKADLRTPLYTGFIKGNPQHRVNSLAWGLDNWIYGANGDSGGLIKSVKTGQTVNIRGRDFRIRPDEGACDAQIGQTQFGRSRDDWGNWFGGNNANPMWHFALEDHYLRRNRHYAAPHPLVQVSVQPGASPVFPISRTVTRFNDLHLANRFTSACSPIIYRDQLFGPEFVGNAFICEPVHNLVHREIVAPQGTTFTSRRADDEQTSEFLASSDNWFRPTMVQTGPDGALWIADMYRAVIEHPEWIPKDWQKRVDLRAGHDKGRIYRVFPTGVRPRPIPRLDKLDLGGLVAAMDSPSGWQRDTAQQLLIQRNDPNAVPLLEKMFESRRLLARLHSMCTLDGIKALSTAILQRALADSHPGVRRHAVRLCESPLALKGSHAESLLKMVNDSDPQVRLQLAYTLGEWNDPRTGEALARLAVHNDGDRFITAAVMSSVTDSNLRPMLNAVLAEGAKGSSTGDVLVNLLKSADAFGDMKALTMVLTEVTKPVDGRYSAWQLSATAALLDTLDRRSQSLAKLADGDAELQQAVKQLSILFEVARALVANTKTSPERKLTAVRLLGRGLDNQREDIAALSGLLTPRVSEEVQAAAVATLGQLREPRAADVLIQGWKGLGPALQGRVLDALLQRDERVERVLDAIEQGKIATAEIDVPRRQRLAAHKNAAIRERAAKIFADALTGDRLKVMEAYRAALHLKGDPQRGTAAFARACASCHRLNGQGFDVGPDLAGLTDKSGEALLAAILDPNRAIESRYLNYAATTKNGLTLTGILASETGNAITLLAQDGKQNPILRTDLEELASTGKSMMPEGLEKDLKPQDVADLIAYLQAAKPVARRKEFPWNKPELVRPATDGSLFLSSTTAEIYGKTLVMERLFGNIRNWRSEDDQAVWTVEVAQPGRYSIWLEGACAESAAGNQYIFEAGGEQITGKIPSTGGWTNYQQIKLGEAPLSPGRQRVVLRPAGKVSAFLVDMRAIRLIPLDSQGRKN